MTMKRHGKRYLVAHRRRREGRTDYRKRLTLLKSGKPRLVVRRSTNNTECQVVKHSHKGDETLLSVNSKHIKALGWKMPTGNIPSSYLIGLLCGVKAREKNIKGAVLDTGVISPTRGSRIYACLKGALDAGIEVPHSDGVVPKEERIRGEHISKGGKSNLPKHFEEIKSKILKKPVAKPRGKPKEHTKPKTK
jgi:large subunit ribosomal protein L18